MNALPILYLWLAAAVPGGDVPPVIELPPPPPVTELGARRQRVLEAMEPGLLIVEAGRPPEGLDVDRDFFYLTGADVAGSVLLLERPEEGEASATLFLPGRSRSWERWNGPRLFPGPEATAVTGIEDVRTLEQYEKERDARLAARPDRVYVAKKLVTEWKKRHPSLEIVSSARLVHALRQIKSDYETEMLRWAIGATGRALHRCLTRVRPGMYEFQVQSLIEGGFMAEGLGAPGFTSVIGSGPNACILHYSGRTRRIEENELLLLDIGARAAGYTADISRTFPVSGRFTPRQREVYGIVLAAQQKTIAAVKPGVTLRDLNRVTRKVFEEHGVRKHFPHGVTHHVGLEVHDVQPVKVLAPGMVVTIEPGLYFEEEGFGVRIEDMVRVTEMGCEVLSADIPRTADEIEALTSRR